MASYERVGREEERKSGRRPIFIGVVVLVACIGLGAVVLFHQEDASYHLETANNILRSWRCPPGGYPSGRGKNGNCLCSICPAGYKCAGGSRGKRPCGPGTFQSRKGQNTCDPAPPGSYVPGNGARQPTPCGYGTYNNKKRQRRCTPASPGNFVPGKGARRQTPCQVGKYQNMGGKRSCKPTPPGTYGDERGQTRGKACNYGTYQDQPGRTRCKPASPGNYVPSRGQRRQLPCGGNTFQHCGGQIRCIPCPAGLHAQRGSRKCSATINGVKCIRGNGGYATIVAPRGGYLKGLTLTHVRGRVYHCGPKTKSCYGKFGSSKRMAVIVTLNQKKNRPDIVFPRRGTQGYKNNMDSYGFYTLSGYNAQSNKIRWIGPRRRVGAGEKFRVYYGESYKKRTLEDNGGETCFRTTFNY